MPTSIKTPGVYIEEVSKFPPSVAQVETAIPAFIGYTEKATDSQADDLIGKATRIGSMREYELLFGGPPAQFLTVTLVDELPVLAEVRVSKSKADKVASPYKMYYALQMFFANGGGPCYIISVSKYDADKVESAKLDDSTGGGLSIARKVDEVTLLLFPDANKLDIAPYYTLYSKAIKQCGELMDRFTVIDIKTNGAQAPTAAKPHKAVEDFRANSTIGTENLKYAAIYYPDLKTVLNYSYDNDHIVFKQAGSNLNGKTMTEALADANMKKKITNEFESNLKAATSRLYVVLPPSSAVVGAYAQVDSTRGVWKAPANIGLNATIEPAAIVSHEDQMDLNVHTSGRSVNAIRTFVGQGTKIWGARTLAGNDNEWRYVPVRRFFNMVEESVKKASIQFVFEPNDANTWVKIRAMIENFLTLQWRNGALAGAKPEQAFYVKVGLGETMTAQDILEGKMIVEIGMAAVRPAEFIILRFSHKMQES